MMLTIRRAAALAFFVLLLVAAGAAAAPGAPELVIEAPPELEPVAARLVAVDAGRLAEVVRLVGLADPGPPIRVVLAPEGSDLARGAPPWVAGYAMGEAGVIVLFPARSPSYPDSSLPDLLGHEVAHVLIARAAGGRPVPRWFHEGLAMVAGGTWGLDDRSRLTFALLADEPVPMAEVERRFAAGQSASGRSYAVSGAFVRDLLDRHGPAAGGEVLAGLAAGLPFPEAFERATGTPLAAAEAAFWSRGTLWYRWVPLLTSSSLLWIGITLLALYAGRRRRARAAALARLWEEEERRRLAAASAPPEPGEELVN